MASIVEDMCEGELMGTTVGRVVSVDRGYPLVLTDEGEQRAQHTIELVKNTDIRAVVGDLVELECPLGQDTPLITAIKERRNVLSRRVLVESRSEGSGKYNEQILAANIDLVFVVVALSRQRIDLNYLERQLVMAHQSGARVVIVLTKSDAAPHLEGDLAAVKSIADECPVIVTSTVSKTGLVEIVELVAEGQIGVLLGRSGVGKSTLINELLGAPLLQTGTVRDKDHAGRHTTVARKLIYLPNGGALIDAPGLRSLGLYDAADGLAATFPEIASRAQDCRFRDCTHSGEAGCAVAAATKNGLIDNRRLDSYRSLAAEVFA